MASNSALKNVINVVAALSPTLGLIADVGGVWSFSKEAMQGLSETYGIPVNVLNIILCGVVLLLTITLLIRIFQSRSGQEEQVRQNEGRSRISYLRWFKKELENRMKSSIGHALYLELKLHDNVQLVNSLNYVYHEHNGSRKESATISSFNNLIQENPFKILLLGAPGAGKTTTLLNCISSCVDQAQQDPNQGIPVFINLSKWKKEQKNYSFGDWIVNMILELKGTGLKAETIKYWLSEEQLILFLDGLDEMPEAIRGDMVGEINGFLDEYPSTSVIVSSRLIDYEVLAPTNDKKLRLDTAVTINELNQDQINQYLQAANSSELHEFISQDEELSKMAKSPLDLSIMVLAYTSSNFAAQISRAGNSVTEKRMILFDAYVQAMAQREYLRQKADRDTPESDLLPTGIVPQEKLDQIYKYFGLISRLLTENSRNYFIPAKIFELYTVNRNSLLGYKNIVSTLLLVAGLIPFLLHPIAVFPNYIPYIMLLTILFIYLVMTCFHASKKLDYELTKKVRPFSRFTEMSMRVISTVLIYAVILGLGNHLFQQFFILWKYGPWLITVLFISFCFMQLYRLGDYKWNPILAIRAETKKHNLLFLCISLILLLLLFFNTNYYTLSIIYLFISFTILNNISGSLDDYWHYKLSERKNVIKMNIWMLVITIPFLFFFETYPGLAIVFVLQLGLAFSILYDDRNDDIPKLWPVFIGLSAAIWLSIILTPLLSAVTGGMIGGLIFLCWKKHLDRLYIAIGSQVILIVLKAKGLLPVRLKKFTKYGRRTLLIKGQLQEVEFIHRRIRDYFAIRELVPRLGEATDSDRLELVKEMANFNDASCDVLLELFDDPNVDVRRECASALGKIGTLYAAKTLLAAERKTSGGLHAYILSELRDIWDVEAVPLLISILNQEPVESELFLVCIIALVTHGHLSHWNNIEKIKEYLSKNRSLDFIQDDLRLHVAINWIDPENTNQTFWSKLADIEISENKLYRVITEKIRLENDEVLANLISHPQNMVAKEAFNLLYKKDQTIAITALIHAVNHYTPSVEVLDRVAHAKVINQVKKINYHQDEGFLLVPIIFILDQLSYKHLEDFILELSSLQKIEYNHALIVALMGTDLQKSVPFLVDSFDYNIECRELIVRVLVQCKHQKYIPDYVTLIDKYPEEPAIAKLIYILSYLNHRESINTLINLLSSKNEQIKNASIYALGQMKAQEFVPALIQMVEECDPVYLETVIYSIGQLRVVSLIPQLPSFFVSNLAYRGSIVSTLIELNAAQELLDVAKQIKAEGITVNNGRIRNAVSIEMVKQGQQELAFDLLFCPLTAQDNFAANEDSRSYLLYKNLGKINNYSGRMLLDNYEYRNLLKDSYQEVEEILIKYIKDNRVPYNGKEMFYNCFHLKKEHWQTVEALNLYHQQFAKEVFIALLDDAAIELSEWFLNKLQSVVSQEIRLLLIVICGYFKIEKSVSVLQGILRDTEDSKDYVFALIALVNLKDRKAVETAYANLTNLDYVKVKGALVAIFYLPYNQISIDNLFLRISQNKFFAEALIDFKYINLLRKLKKDELSLLLSHNDTVIRYAAIKYIGLLGNGSFIPVLGLMMSDWTQVVLIGSGQQDTISNAAWEALKMIGTPSANIIINNWGGASGE